MHTTTRSELRGTSPGTYYDQAWLDADLPQTLTMKRDGPKRLIVQRGGRGPVVAVFRCSYEKAKVKLTALQVKEKLLR